MKNIGMTVHYGIFIPHESDPAEDALREAYGSADKLLETYARLGVDSVELSTLHTRRPADEMMAVCRKIMDAGMHLTIHGTTENISGQAHFDFFAPLYEEILRRQQEVTVTLHAPGDRNLAVSILADWCQEGMRRYPQVLFAEENQRVHRPEHGEHFRINAIAPTLPRTGNVGICWDMGHYAYNLQRAELPGETLPAPETMKLIRHTHIHGLLNMKTHFPIQGEPVTTYVQALKKQGYAGVYNLEVKPSRFIHVFPDVKTQMENSILRLQEMINE